MHGQNHIKIKNILETDYLKL